MLSTAGSGVVGGVRFRLSPRSTVRTVAVVRRSFAIGLDEGSRRRLFAVVVSP